MAACWSGDFEDDYGVRGKERPWELSRVTGPQGPLAPCVKFTSNDVLPGRFGRAMDWLVTRHAVARRSREYLRRLARLVEHPA